MKEKIVILKVQVPLATNAKESVALVYNKSRKVEFFMPIDDGLIKTMAGAPKKYFQAELLAGGVKFKGEVPDPGW